MGYHFVYLEQCSSYQTHLFTGFGGKKGKNPLSLICNTYGSLAGHSVTGII